MAVVKLTKSGSGVLFIDDEGNVFITSVSYVRSLLDKTLKFGLCHLTRMPNKVSTDRFGKSKVYDAGGTGVTTTKDDSLTKDGLSSNFRKRTAKKERYTDTGEW